MQITNLSKHPDTQPASTDDAFLLTTLDISTISAAVSALPAQWFTSSVVRDHDASGGEVFNYMVLEQISGPSFGVGFAIERRGNRLLVTNSETVDREPEVVASAESAGDAVQAVGRLIEQRLTAWGVRAVSG